MENTKAKKAYLTALDEYINKVYILVLLLVPGACQCAGLAYTFEKFMGWLPSVSWTALIIFDVTCLIYLTTGIILIKTGFKDGLVRQSRLKIGKVFLVLIMLIQFNFILYMIPATDFWGFAFFFVILTSFFLDFKMVAVASAEIAGSLVVAWFLYGEIHLPAEGEHFMVNFLDRIICVALSLPTVVLLTYLIGRFLVNAKKDELERNTERTQSVLNSVQELSGKLAVASATLSEIAVNEGESAEKLTDTSARLMQNSNMLSRKTEESLSNLDELNRWEAEVSDNVGKVETASVSLLEKSRDNEILLGNLRTVNGEVTQAMAETNEVADKLSAAVKEIGLTLKLIDEISTNTHILSINASIEAARVGQAGKGFAVVAQEVGSLAQKTKKSLGQIELAIKRVQDNVNEITAHIQDNSRKLSQQNEYFSDVFSGMQEMSTLLNTSSEAVGQMGNAYAKQNEVVRNTVQINQDIAGSIRTENEQFVSITAMAESNANDIERMTEQITSINDMVEEINNILSV